MTRHERVAKAIERGNVLELLSIIEWGPCARCDGNPQCDCKLSAKQVRDAVSYAALKRGRVVQLKQS